MILFLCKVLIIDEVEQLNKPGLVTEGQSVHLDAKVEPRNDPNLKIEWEVNGQVLETGRKLFKQLLTTHSE